MENSRGYKLMRLGQDRKRLATLNVPKYERTCGTNKWEQTLAIKDWASYNQSVAQEMKITKRTKNVDCLESSDPKNQPVTHTIRIETENVCCDMKNEWVNLEKQTENEEEHKITEANLNEKCILLDGVDIPAQLLVECNNFELINEVVHLIDVGNGEEKGCVDRNLEEDLCSEKNVLEGVDNPAQFLAESNSLELNSKVVQLIGVGNGDEKGCADRNIEEELCSEKNVLEGVDIPVQVSAESNNLELNNEVVHLIDVGNGEEKGCADRNLEEDLCSEKNVLEGVDIHVQVAAESNKLELNNEVVQLIDVGTGEEGGCGDRNLEEDLCSEKNTNIDVQALGTDGEEEEAIEIASVAKHPSGKRRRSKLHCCKYCYKLIVGIGRHILTVHKEELEVAYVLSLNKENRKIHLEQLEREGDYNHNKEVLATGKGELILVRRPTESEILSHTYEDYGPCTGCLGFMLKAHLWHHVKYGCKAIPKGVETPFSVRLGSEALLAAGLRDTYSPEFEEHCIGKLVKDDIGNVCKKEESILRYGDYLFQKNLTVDPNQRANNVRSTMRVLTTLYVRLQEQLPSIRSFIDIFDPRYFNTIVITVRSMCEYNGISKKSDVVSPSKAIRLGIELVKMGEFVHGEHIMKGDSTKEKSIKKFIFLVKTQWNTRISCTARSTLEQRKFNKAEVLPLTSDLLKVNKHVHDVCISSKAQLEKEINPAAYRKLSEALLARIVLFNKRRSGETSKLKIKQYLERGNWAKETTEELKSTLSKTEQDLAENLTLVYTKGKRKDKVPILLTSDMKEMLELLLRVRHMHGIDKDNPYVFARPYPAETPLRGHDCVRSMCEGAGLGNIERVTGTKLRKYVATVSQVFNLTENETDWLAKHMGHDIRVHRQFYRLHESALELTKVSRILMAIDKGEANRYAGKTLNEINIEEMSDLEEDEGTEGTGPPKQDGVPLEICEGESSCHNDSNFNHEVSLQTNESEDEEYNPEEDSEDLTQSNKKRKTKIGRSTKKRPWSAEEKTAVLQFFRDTISKRLGVKKDQADKCLEIYSVLNGRTWLNIRDFVRNHIRKLT